MLVSASSSIVWIKLNGAFASCSFTDGNESSTIWSRRLVGATALNELLNDVKANYGMLLIILTTYLVEL